MDGWQDHIWSGWKEITEKLKEELKSDDVLVLDGYHGTDWDEVKKNLIDPLHPDAVFFAETARLSEKELYPKIERNVTDDRVFGSISTHTMADFYDPEKTEKLKKQIEEKEGLRIVYGTGAGFVYPKGLRVFCDLTRWEIQLRYRDGMTNWQVDNPNEDILRKYKRGYFVEWRVQDRHKHALMSHLDFLIETNRRNDPAMIDMKLLNAALDAFVSEPFRLIPYFDEGIWGGKWMEEVCALPHGKHNMAWCFDGVPEENSIGIEAGGKVFEMPAMNLVKERPAALLGPKVYSRFGAEFPIRFDFLDTMGGDKLSLQVHPLTEYIKDNFGMAYTQDESYYILDAGTDASVYLGVKEGTKPEELIKALKEAQEGGHPFDDTKFINNFPVKKHDHLLIPAGTIHCSGENAMVLEISATPYIFTMKLWDWGRVGLDGKPRPINVDRGADNIQFDRTTEWCRKNLVSPVEVLHQEEGIRVEKTGLHELEFIETDRYWFDRKVCMDCSESVHMLNLVEGEEAEITSPDGSFEPYRVHYAETFILPAGVRKYCIEPAGKSKGKTIAVIQASVRV